MAFLSRLKALRRTSKNRPAFSCSQISICATLYILFCFNIPVLNKIYHEHGLHNLHDFGFMLSATILTGILIHLTVMMLGFRPFFKPAIILLIITSAATSYFMRSYHIMIDSSMMANIIETDYKEG
ncbi:MAG: DUF1705 domain-containing protein, partial [Pseudomonadales bacterium]|nr:DUF1705 domain-containing protein [Pseudomonadales bacterium]